VNWRNRQQKMDSDRVRQVQEALIREHYLTGQANGVWDQKSQNAMIRLQGENGWQTKVVPDSRALIKLGLGPTNDHLLNPESAIRSPLQPASAMQHTAPVSTPANPSAAGTLDPVSTPQ
jgi:peptidoglycan hydrolase-like protein with peptidoglycan-binding domain